MIFILSILLGECGAGARNPAKTLYDLIKKRRKNLIKCQTPVLEYLYDEEKD
jgi:hypothetical protein